MSRTAGRVALIFALVGLAVSSAAAYTHYHMLRDPTYQSFCDVSATVSCTQVYQSRYSTVAGVPVAIFGALWFTFAALLSIAGLMARPTVRENVPGYLFAMSTVALAVVLYLGYASFFLLKAVCLLCLTTYVAVIALFLVSGAATSFPMTTLPRRATADARVFFRSPLALTLAVLFFAGAATTLAFFPREGVSSGGAAAATAAPAPTQDQKSEFERWYLSQPRIPLVVPAEGAKVLIVKFNDFQCPACGQSYLLYKPVLAKYEAEHPGAVKMVLKDYPLNRDCNEALSTTLHPSACDAAVAVRLAQARNKGPELEEWLYTHQQGMTPPAVRQAARDIGGVTDFDAKYAATLSAVKSDINLGKQLGIKATPTFFINGVKIESAIAPQYFDQAIAYELQHAK
ncbi:MAG TPA: vitamin K epoxide reductase family protein [Vicinamibacterales bacterium]|nr:vitamin K epoxide reductase family protein [Vicinamibacterales bacterium]